MKEIQSFSDPNTVVMLVGNKSDLKHLRAVTVEEGQNLAKEHSLLFMETSALDATNVEEAFHIVLEEIFRIVNKIKLTNEEKKDEKKPDIKTVKVESKPQEQPSQCPC